MAKKDNFLKKVSLWCFDEEEDTSEDSPDYIELNKLQIILLLIITVGFLGYIIYSVIIENRPIKSTIQMIIKDKVEDNYFKNGRQLENSDFSQGLNHWGTSDGGKLFPDSKSEAILDTSEFHSSPASLKIIMGHSANRYYYTKNKALKVINNPYDILDPDASSVWLGVLPHKEILVNFWYKGAVLTVYLKGLKNDGSWIVLKREVGITTRQWKNLSVKVKAPKDIIAICLEFAINRDANDPVIPVVWIDDVNLTVE